MIGSQSRARNQKSTIVAFFSSPKVSLVLVALDVAEEFPADAVGDATEFLDVDVDQVAGALTFVAANDAPRRTVHPLQTVESELGQRPVHRRGGDAQSVANARRSEVEGGARFSDLGLDLAGGLMRTLPRCSSDRRDRAQPPRTIDATTDRRWGERCPFRGSGVRPVIHSQFSSPNSVGQ